LIEHLAHGYPELGRTDFQAPVKVRPQTDQFRRFNFLRVHVGNSTRDCVNLSTNGRKNRMDQCDDGWNVYYDREAATSRKEKTK